MELRPDPLQELEQDEPPMHVLSRLLYREDPRMVQAVYVRGKACFTRNQSEDIRRPEPRIASARRPQGA